MKFNAMQSLISIETQRLSYGMNNLIADTGGYLGLLLGFSILSILKKALGVV